jgi:predicted RNase H-like HicB family nuclease
MSDDNVYGHYSMSLKWDPIDEIYIVSVPELPGCMTHGATREEAVRQGQLAIESWIDASREWKQPIPSPELFELDLVPSSESRS